MDMNSAASTSSMQMIMDGSPTAASAAASSTAAMGGMDMGGGMGPNSCRISMLWNWYTVNSCFIARSWHVRSEGAFAGSCIGVILLVVALEFLRRAQRSFDRYLRRSELSKQSASITPEAKGDNNAMKRDETVTTVSHLPFHAGEGVPVRRTLKVWQQMVRSVLYMLQFAVAYFVMLLAMYYNGYIIICIFIGAFLGAAIFQWDTYVSPTLVEQREACC